MTFAPQSTEVPHALFVVVTPPQKLIISLAPSSGAIGLAIKATLLLTLRPITVEGFDFVLFLMCRDRGEMIGLSRLTAANQLSFNLCAVDL
jgi:hypothetical protein